MKKVLVVFLSALLIITLSNRIDASGLEEYRDEIYNSVNRISQLDISIDKLENVDVNRIGEYIFSIIKQCIRSPAKIICTVMVISVLQQLTDILTNAKQQYRDIFTMITFAAITPQIMSAIEDISDAMNSVQYFMAGYIPIFASVIGCSGNLSAATSYNGILLYATEGAAIALTAFVKPLLLCMIVTSVIRGINSDMPDVPSALRRMTVTLTGFIMSIFLGIIGLQGIVGRTQDSLTLKAGKYLVSSFVPIIGGSLNESYRTVKAGLDSIRSLLGTFGIVVIVAVLSLPIIKGYVFRWSFILCEFISGIVGGNGISNLCKSLSDVFLLLTTVITIYMLMLVISTGAMISLGGSIA